MGQIRNSSDVLLGGHFWGVNSEFCVTFIIQIRFCDIRKNIPKAMEWGWAPHLYWKCSFCGFFCMASLIPGIFALYCVFSSVDSFYSGWRLWVCALLTLQKWSALRPQGGNVWGFWGQTFFEQGAAIRAEQRWRQTQQSFFPACSASLSPHIITRLKHLIILWKSQSSKSNI